MKKILVLGISCMLVLSMAGCQPKSDIVVTNNQNNIDVGKDKTNSDELTTEEGYFVPNTDAYEIGDIITTGKIILFEGEYVHIISGDMVEIFKYNNEQSKKFYVGQTVSLVKRETNDELESFITEDFTIRHTNMGQIIDSTFGKVLEVGKDYLTLKNGDDETTISTYEPTELSIGTNVTAYSITFNKDQSLVYVLNEDTKLVLSVKELNRSEEGDLILDLIDENGGEYVVNASNSMIELNMSEIKVGDMLTVYHEGIMESYPMQLMTVLIRK